MAVFLGGALSLLATAWRDLLPRSSPSPWVLTLACLVVALADFALAMVFALQPIRPPDTWRPAVVAAAAVAGAAAAMTAPAYHVRLILPCAAVAILALRTAETLGRHLAPILRLPSDYRFGEWANQDREARRAVLEVWVALALLTALAHLGRAAVPGLVAVGASGLAIAAGARLSWADGLAAEEGYDWPEQDRRRAWRGVGVLSAVALAVALAVPGIPPLFSGRVIGAPFAWGMHFLFAGSGTSASHVTPSTRTAPPIALPLAAAGGAVTALAGLLAGFWELRQNLLIVVPAAIVVVLVVAYLRHVFDPRGGDWLSPLRRLWEALLGLFGFWQWLSQAFGRREERLREALEGAGARGRAAESDAPRRAESWLDPRRAIRAAYRRYLQGGAEVGRARHDAETPADYALRLGADLGAASPEASRLTRAYEEARFSDHRVNRSLAGTAIAAMRRATAALRRAK